MSISLSKGAFAVPSPRAAAPGPCVYDDHGRDRPGAPGARIGERDSGEEEAWSDPVTEESEVCGGPVRPYHRELEWGKVRMGRPAKESGCMQSSQRQRHLVGRLRHLTWVEGRTSKFCGGEVHCVSASVCLTSSKLSGLGEVAGMR